MLSYRGGNNSRGARQSLFPYPSNKTIFSFKDKPITENEIMWGRIKRHKLPLLCLLWVFTIYFAERILPSYSINQCDWSHKFNSSNRVALVADPQIIDENTYPWRPNWLLGTTKYITDLYLRKNWVYINRKLDPDSNIFLGDLFDGGREWNDTQWRTEFERYNKIFTKPAFKKTVMSLPGNHDIGFGDDIVPHAHGRFQAFFGPASSTVEVGNHTFVLLDTISMMNKKNQSIWQPPLQFMEKVGQEEQKNPRILLTHVPLYRPKSLTCGKSREHGETGLPYIGGKQYQTLVTPELSTRILNTIKPMAVFSGDDHDACHVEHEYQLGEQNNKKVDEFTVKSISMAMGIKHPGIQLVTLNANPTSNLQDMESNMQTSICLMPSPFLPFIIYAVFGVFSLFILFATKNKHTDQYLPLPLHKSSSSSSNSSAPKGSSAKLLIFKQIAVILVVGISWFFILAWSIYRYF